jgi:hypothetical protein
MPLHLNLYHEIERDKQVKARDPLKLTIIGLIFVGALFAGYYFWQLGVMSGINGKLVAARADFARLEPQAKEALARTEELNQIVKTSDLLVKSVESRIYWATLLQEFSALVPPEVQITRFSGTVEGGVDYKKCLLTVEGISSGAGPRKTAEDLRSALAEGFEKRFKGVTSIFRSLEDGSESVVVNGSTMPTAVFQIALQFSQGTEPAAAAPTKRTKR